MKPDKILKDEIAMKFKLLAIFLLALPCLADGPVESQARLRKLVISSLQVSTSSLDELRSSGKSGMTAIENFLSERSALDVKQVEGLVEKLGSTDYKIRQEATDLLSVFPKEAIPELENYLKPATDPEIKGRLKTALTNIKISEKRHGELLSVLHSLYEDNAEDIFKEMLPVVKADPNNIRAVYALDNISFDKAWKILETATRDEKLIWLLLKMSRSDKLDEIEEKLKAFKADDLLRVAALTWWPVEIEPLQKDGAYGWTTRAQLMEGNVAWNVIRLSVKMPDYGNVDERGEWEHLTKWGRLTYIFQFPEYPERNVIAYAEPYNRCADFTGWKVVLTDESGKRQGNLDAFRGIPPGVKLPLARISMKEVNAWRVHFAFIWAKPLFPPDIAMQIKFGDNMYGVPAIEMPEKASGTAKE